MPRFILPYWNVECVKPAPSIYMSPPQDIMVQCGSCNGEISGQGCTVAPAMEISGQGCTVAPAMEISGQGCILWLLHWRYQGRVVQ